MRKMSDHRVKFQGPVSLGIKIEIRKNGGPLNWKQEMRMNAGLGTGCCHVTH